MDLAKMKFTAFYVRLWRLCKKKGITLERMVSILGWARSLPKLYAQGKIPTKRKIVAIAKFFGVEPDYFTRQEESHLAKQLIEEMEKAKKFYDGHLEPIRRVNAFLGPMRQMNVALETLGRADVVFGDAVLKQMRQMDVVLEPVRRANAMLEPIRQMNTALEPLRQAGTIFGGAVLEQMRQMEAALEPLRRANAILEPIQRMNRALGGCCIRC